MNKITPEISSLIYGHIKGGLSEEEKEKLESWLNDRDNRALFEQICNREAILKKSLKIDHYDSSAAWNKINGRIPARHTTKWWAYAAVALLFLTLGGVAYQMLVFRPQHPQVEVAEKITPGIHTARIRLADGRIVDLQPDSAYTQLQQEGMTVKKENGMLSFEAGNATPGQEVTYSLLETPRGGEYKVILPDGTKVWLNTESSLRFPSSFTGDVRKVAISGEVYFEVAKDASKPFIVEMARGTIQVLGTVFNVRAYESEACVTTLVSGSVQLKNKTGEVLLKPGQQAVLEKNREQFQVNEVDVRTATAWKNGYFLFENMRLEDILTELGRWYDMNVFYSSSGVREERFSVEMKRHENFEEVLKKIEATGAIHLNVQGRTVIVR